MQVFNKGAPSFFSSPRPLIVLAFASLMWFGATMPTSAAQDGASVVAVDATMKAAAEAAQPVKKPEISVRKARLAKRPVQGPEIAPPPTKIVPGMGEPLVAMGHVSDAENKDLDDAIAAFRAAPAAAGPGGDFSDYAKPLLAFIDSHPQSNWNVALWTNIGLGYYHSAYYSRAIDAFQKAWDEGRNATNPHAQALVDRALGELAHMHARLGHDKELTALLTDTRKRPLTGPATVLIQTSREGLWQFHHDPGMAYLCGPRALENVLIHMHASDKQIKLADDARSGPHGFTLEQLATLATKAGLKFKLVQRKPGQPVPVPSIINWSTHHFAAITEAQDGGYHIEDPTFGDASGVFATEKAIDAEGSGYFLVPDSATANFAKTGWRAVDAHSKEAKAVYGMGQPSTYQKGDTRPYDQKAGCSDCSTSTQPTPAMSASPDGSNIMPGIAQPANNSAGSGCPGGCGMAHADAHLMAVSLNITDTPVGYKPQKGVAAYTTLTYNSLEAEQPATFSFSNLSAKWSHTWMSYIIDDPVHPGQTTTRAIGGGGGHDYSNYNGSTGLFYPEPYDMSVLKRVPASGTLSYYEHDLPDGSVEIYSQVDGAATYPRRVFLTSVKDPAGNTTTLTYDGSLRLTTVTDAMGRNTTFSYGLGSYPLLITEIDDAFGRSTTMTYDSSQRLETITDPVGITSTFTYIPLEPDFIDSMTTPYGTSRFSDAVNYYDTPEDDTRWLTMTDPMGYSQLIYFYQNPNITPSTTSPLPGGSPLVDNGLLQWRNTYYWDQHAFAQAITTNHCGEPIQEDFSQAKLYHWLHDYLTAATSVSTQIASIKLPLEERIWLNYANQSTSYKSSSEDRPKYAGRVMDDGSTQYWKMTYNTFTSYGKPLTITDPLNRVTKYTYDTNNIDLLTVQQLTTSPSTYTTIATYGSYNSLHEPQTYTGPDGQTWHYTYNTDGQLATVTDPNSGVTTYNYDGSDRLSTIEDANSQTVLTLTYDSADRVYTSTDDQGYTLTYDYDDLNRVTQITYPDSTTDQYDYTFQSGPHAGDESLDLRKYTDRLGRVTTYDYDADRRLISVMQPTSGGSTRTTSYDYYENGVLKDITDANNNVTHWDIDIEGRPTSKTYQYGTASAKTETYTYETNTSRLKSVTDALGQVKTYSYDNDDELTGITYTSTVNPTSNVTFTYDTYFPRLKTMGDGIGTTNYGYTAIGSNGGLKLSSIDGPYSNDTLGLTYDAIGLLSGETISGGNETLGYDAINRLTSHGTPLGTFTNTYLGETNQQTGRSVTNGMVTVSTAWGYDTNTNDRRLISITNNGVTRSYTLGYGSSPVNPYDILSITDTAATGHPWATQSHSYTYDDIDRLLTGSSTTPGNFAYAYDDVDNPTTWTDPSGTTNPTYNGFNQIDTWGTNTYSYDDDGNLLSGDGVKSYKWDAENRLVEIDYASGPYTKSQFTYNGVGQRVQDVETASGGGTTTTRYMWCGGVICQERNGSDTVLRRYMAEGEYDVSGTQKLVYMPDQLNSVRDVIDADTGNLVQSYDFTPYGGIARSNGSTPTDYRYAELFYHPNSALNFSATRALDGATGRWLNRDLFGEIGGINLYGYVAASTTNYTDPSGQCGLACDAAAAAAACAANAACRALAMGVIIAAIGSQHGMSPPGNVVPFPQRPGSNDNQKSTPKPAPQPQGTCPFVRELPESMCVPRWRTCIYQCDGGLRSEDVPRNFSCRPAIPPDAGRPYSPAAPVK